MLIHSNHPKYDSLSKTTDFLNDLMTSDQEELKNLNKTLIKSYGIASADIIAGKIPEKLIVDSKSYDLLLNGKPLLSKVSFGGSVTILEGTYDIYLDSQKYSGTELVKALSIDTLATVVSFRVSNNLDKYGNGTLGYLVPLADGTIAYFINKTSTSIKTRLIENINNRQND